MGDIIFKGFICICFTCLFMFYNSHTGSPLKKSPNNMCAQSSISRSSSGTSLFCTDSSLTSPYMQHNSQRVNSCDNEYRARVNSDTAIDLQKKFNYQKHKNNSNASLYKQPSNWGFLKPRNMF